MRVGQIAATTLEECALDPLSALEPNLVLAFAAPQYFTDRVLPGWLAKAFPDARRIVLSTAGEITSQGVNSDSIVVTAVRLERSPFRIAAMDIAGMEDSAGAGRRLAEQLAAPDLKAVILLSQGVAVNGSDLIAGTVALLGQGVPITGGLAGDNGAFTRTCSLLDDRVSEKLMLAIGLYGDALHFAHGSFGGWQSFGPPRKATRAEGNVLYELDGEPALGIYKRYLGDYAQDLPASGLLFPFAILSDDHQETGLVRTLLDIDEAQGSLILAGDIPPRRLPAADVCLHGGPSGRGESSRPGGQGNAIVQGPGLGLAGVLHWPQAGDGRQGRRRGGGRRVGVWPELHPGRLLFQRRDQPLPEDNGVQAA